MSSTSQLQEPRAFSSEFEKSRQRLIYFSAIGILLIIFPISESSSLFGITFENLSGQDVVFLFIVLGSVIFVDHFIKLIEEGPLLMGNYREAFERYSQAAKRMEQLSSEWRSTHDNIRFFSDQLNRLIESLNDPNTPLLKNTARSDIGNVLNALANTDERISSLANLLKKMYPNVLEPHRPSFIPGRTGLIRVCVEGFSGTLTFILFLAIFFIEKALPVF